MTLLTRCERYVDMDPELRDPLERLAAALERLAAANLAMSNASERLATIASDPDAYVGLVQAAAVSRRAARTAAEASARAAA